MYNIKMVHYLYLGKVTHTRISFVYFVELNPNKN